MDDRGPAALAMTTEVPPHKTRHREARSDAAIHTAVPFSQAVWTATALRASQ